MKGDSDKAKDVYWPSVDVRECYVIYHKVVPLHFTLDFLFFCFKIQLLCESLNFFLFQLGQRTCIYLLIKSLNLYSLGIKLKKTNANASSGT